MATKLATLLFPWLLLFLAAGCGGDDPVSNNGSDTAGVPVLATIGPRTVLAGLTLGFQVSATNPDGPSPSLTAEDLPANASFVDHGDGSGTFAFAPTQAQVGLFEIRFIAANDSLADTELVSVSVEDLSFVAHVQPILSANCATSGCHAGLGAPLGLNLVAGSAYGNLVDVVSQQVGSRKRITPGDAENSYLIIKIEGRQTVGTRMPQPPRPALSPEDIMLIRTWIDQGAAND